MRPADGKADPMTFNEAEYEILIEQLDALAAKVAKLIDSIGPRLQSSLSNPLIPDDMKSAIAFAGRTITRQSQFAMNTIQTRAARARVVTPTALQKAAEDWRRILGDASTMAEGIRTKDAVGSHWSGDAFNKYVAEKPLQSAAAKRVGAIAKVTATALEAVADAERTRLQNEIIATIALVGALALAVLASSTGPVAVAGAVFAVASYLATVWANDADFQAKCKSLAGDLTSEENDKGDFGDDLWPKAVAANFRKATPEDDDISDWDVGPRASRE
jgi:hypothetical protein